MMRIALVTFATAILLCGCGPQTQPDPAPAGQQSAQHGSIRMGLSLSSPELQVGQTVTVTLTVTNAGEQPLRITAPTSAKAFVQIYQLTAAGWDLATVYPQTTAQVINPWSIEPGQTWTQDLVLPVEPDWPRGVPLSLRAYLNGRPDLFVTAPARVVRPAPVSSPAAQPVQPE